MKTYTQEQIEERFAELPEVVQNALASSETGEMLRRIGTRHNLHIDQMGTLNDVTVFVILNIIPRASYMSTLVDELHITEEQARTIVEDVNREILTPINTALKQTTASQNDQEEEESTMPTRDEILREIESPRVTTSREAVRTTPSSIAPREEVVPQEGRSLSHTPITDANDTPPLAHEEKEGVMSDTVLSSLKDAPREVPPAPSSLLEKKLTQTTHIAPTQSSIEEKKNPNHHDPYREPME